MLEDKVIVVTGGARGLGLAMVRALSRERGRVIAVDLDAGNLEAIDDTNLTFIPCDVTRAEDVQRVISRTISDYGRVDGLVNNAGVGLTGPLLDLTEAQFDNTVNVNLRGVFLFLQVAIRQMLKQPGGGSIVNIASVGGLVGTPELALYTMSKHGVLGLTKSAALEFADRRVRINAVCPGPVWTTMMQQSAEAMYGVGSPEEVARLQNVPRGTLGTPEDVAEMVVWLLSDKSRNCVGSAFTSDGGYTAQ